MAELALKAVSPVTPTTPPSSAVNTVSQRTQSQTDESAPEKANFAQVLRERHNASKNEDKSVAKPTAKKESTDKPQAMQHKAEAPPAPTEEAPAATMPVDALSNLLKTESETGEQLDERIAALAPADDAALIDPSLLAQMQPTEPAAIVANVLPPQANLASEPASIAGDAGADSNASIAVDIGTVELAATDAKSAVPEPSNKATAKVSEELSAPVKVEARAEAPLPAVSGGESASVRQAAMQAFSAAQNAAGSNAAQQATPPAPQVVHTPVGARGWSEEVGQRLVWSATKDNGIAEIVLTPPQLGRVEVSITMNGEQATANFIAGSQAAREALQDAMPRLREILAQAGIQLGQTNVSAGNSGNSQADNGAAGRNGHFGRGGAESNGEFVGTNGSAWVKQGRGLIDTFA